MSLAENLTAIVSELDRQETNFHVLQNDTGWCVEVEDEVSGKDLEDLIKVIDTQAHVVAVIIPHVGLHIQTATYQHPEDIE